MIPKYEYRTIEIIPRSGLFSIRLDQKHFDEMLNRMGNEGWELTTSTPLTINSTTKIIYYTFKRAI